jgi:uncharacterized protein with HEPN domain
MISLVLWTLIRIGMISKQNSAVERQLQILTEAAIRLGEVDGPKFLGPTWKGYCNMGNIIRHAYHKVDDTIIWDTVSTDLPVLKAALRKTAKH